MLSDLHSQETTERNQHIFAFMHKWTSLDLIFPFLIHLRIDEFWKLLQPQANCSSAVFLAFDLLQHVEAVKIYLHNMWVPGWATMMMMMMMMILDYNNDNNDDEMNMTGMIININININVNIMQVKSNINRMTVALKTTKMMRPEVNTDMMASFQTNLNVNEIWQKNKTMIMQSQILHFDDGKIKCQQLTPKLFGPVWKKSKNSQISHSCPIHTYYIHLLSPNMSIIRYFTGQLKEPTYHEPPHLTNTKSAATSKSQTNWVSMGALVPGRGEM